MTAPSASTRSAPPRADRTSLTGAPRAHHAHRYRSRLQEPMFASSRRGALLLDGRDGEHAEVARAVATRTGHPPGAKPEQEPSLTAARRAGIIETREARSPTPGRYCPGRGLFGAARRPPVDRQPRTSVVRLEFRAHYGRRSRVPTPSAHAPPRR
jgi:hypothetical protein